MIFTGGTSPLGVLVTEVSVVLAEDLIQNLKSVAPLNTSESAGAANTAAPPVAIVTQLAEADDLP
jgi:hypothetical protein